MDEFLTTSALTAFLALMALEVVLGVDNVVFIPIRTEKLPEKHRPSGRRWGLIAGAVGRLVLLGFVTALTRLKEVALFSAFGQAVSLHDAILLGGGAVSRRQGHVGDPRDPRGRGGPPRRGGNHSFGGGGHRPRVRPHHRANPASRSRLLHRLGSHGGGHGAA